MIVLTQGYLESNLIASQGYVGGSAPPTPGGNPPYRFSDSWSPATSLEGGFGPVAMTDSWGPTHSISGGVGG